MTATTDWFLLIVTAGVLTAWVACCCVCVGVWLVYRNPATRTMLALFACGAAINCLAIVVVSLRLAGASADAITIAQAANVPVAAVALWFIPDFPGRVFGRPPRHRHLLDLAALVAASIVVAIGMTVWLRTRSTPDTAWSREAYRLFVAIAYVGGASYILSKRPPAGLERRVLTLSALSLLTATLRIAVILKIYSGATNTNLSLGAAARIFLVSMLITVVTGGLGISAVLLLEVRGIQRTSARRRLAWEAATAESYGRFAAGLAHDFANAMQLVSLSTHTLMASTAAQEGLLLKQVADVARSRMRRLMEFARAAPKLVQPLDVGALLTRMTPLLRQLVPSHQLAFVGTGRRMVVACDAEALERAVVELVENAVEWSPPGSAIVVSLGREVIHRLPTDLEGASPLLSEGAYAHLVVADNGSGISADDLPKIFDPSFSRHDKRSSGLGLPMVRSSVRSVGGDVVVVSGPGQGTFAHLWLPLAPQ